MSTRLFISIITPSLNQAAFLGEALQSVRSQQYLPHEHLVLDGGSADRTRDLLETFSRSDSGNHLTWRSHRDGGQSAALNEGFAAAKGDIIGWLNADDRYRPECFDHVVQTFAQHPEIDILYGDYTLMDQAGCHLELRREIEFNRFILNYHRVLYIPTTATFFRRRIFEEGHFLNESLHYAMDLDFFIRLATAGHRFQHLSRVLADFRVHPDSKSARFLDLHRQEHRNVVLSQTPLVRRFSSVHARNAAATLLQIPAGLRRYSEKLLRGYYLRERYNSPSINEQLL